MANSQTNTKANAGSLPRLVRLHQEAAEAVIAAVKHAYPVGCTVQVTVSNSVIVGEVTGHHDTWWYDVGRITIRNLRTGKYRKVSALPDYSDIRRLGA